MGITLVICGTVFLLAVVALSAWILHPAPALPPPAPEPPAPEPTPVPVSVLASCLRQRVLITLKGGAAFQGVLVDEDERGLRLQEAEAVGAGLHGKNIPVDGVMVLLTSEILYIQLP